MKGPQPVGGLVPGVAEADFLAGELLEHVVGGAGERVGGAEEAVVTAVGLIPWAEDGIDGDPGGVLDEGGVIDLHAGSVELACFDLSQAAQAPDGGDDFLDQSFLLGVLRMVVIEEA